MEQEQDLTEEARFERPVVSIRKLMISDETLLEFDPGSILVIVGPNNCGKSEALRGIRARAESADAENPVIKFVGVDRQGSKEDLMAWLETVAIRSPNPPTNHRYRTLGVTAHQTDFESAWDEGQMFGNASRFFVHLLTTEERLSAANPANQIRLTTDPPVHPLHFLQKDDALEKTISDIFRKAFNKDFVIHRNAGSQVPALVGDKPTPTEEEDRVSISYLKRLEKLSPIQEQGDGMRSFAGVVLHTSVGPESVLLVDEPEAFLHPPQARLMGNLLVSGKPGFRQLFIATHSGDVLRGILDADSSKVEVLRLSRDGDVNKASLLDAASISELWSDPLLRYSNVLDGLFHEMVVVCESDGDCRFYSAILDAVVQAEGESVRPAVMFTHCGGKDRMHVVSGALDKVGVPIRMVLDFDVLRSEYPLRRIVESVGGDWSSLEQDYLIVKNAVDSKKPELDSVEVSEQICKVIEQVGEGAFPDEARNRIRGIMKRSTPWSIAKTVGSSWVPSGGPTQALKRLFMKLKNLGIFVVPVGEVEGFYKKHSGHGPKWVNKVLAEDMVNDPDLEEARQFVFGMINRV